jgi:polyhydroxyalkanoate synthase subunit PhaE
VAIDPWRQWAAFFARLNPAADLAGAGASPHFAPFMDAERFAAAARAFYQNSSGSQAAASQAFEDFLRDQFASLLKTPGTMGPAADPGPFLAKNAPALGATREHQERWQRAADAWERFDEAQRRLQRLWSDTLSEAASAFIARMGMPTAPLSLDTVHRLYDTWVDAAEEAYARMAHGEPFCRALGDAVNASSEWRREFSACLEVWAKWLDWPTRSEVNSLTQRVRALEKELGKPPRAREPRKRTRKARGRKPAKGKR